MQRRISLIVKRYSQRSVAQRANLNLPGEWGGDEKAKLSSGTPNEVWPKAEFGVAEVEKAEEEKDEEEEEQWEEGEGFEGIGVPREAAYQGIS